LLVAVAIATALLFAASARLPSLTATVLAAYVGFAGGVTLVVLVLSPLHAVTRGGIAVAETTMLVIALVCWTVRGRPRPATAAARNAFRAIATDSVTGPFLAVTLAILGYEVLLALAVPPDNWDSLTYHLARVAAWAQHGGFYWIPNAPDDRLNEFQPLAEQEILYFVVAGGSTRLFALPQLFAEFAILAGVYGTARRLGFEVRPAACAAFLVATFSVVVLEATTAQNDLVAASFPLVAACLILDGGRFELALAGAALALGAGAKLTTVLVWPVLVWLALLRGRAAAAVVAAGGIAAFVLVGMWGFVLNLAHTGLPLGHGGGRREWTASPSLVGTAHTAVHVLYRVLDPSVLSNRLIVILGVGGVVAGTLLAGREHRRGARGVQLLGISAVALPALAPALVIAGGAALAAVASGIHLPVHSLTFGPGEAGLNRVANEDDAAFGPVGSLAVLAVPGLGLWSVFRHQVDPRRLALSTALPCFLILLSLYAAYDPWLTRFLVVPMALGAPMYAWFLRDRDLAAAVLAVAALTAVLTLTHDGKKPLESPFGPPWQLTWSQALALQNGNLGGVLDAYAKFVPPGACVGAVLRPEEPSYLLYGPKLTHRVVYLPQTDPLSAASRYRLDYVVISQAPGLGWPEARVFTGAGWKIENLGRYWLLVVSRRSGARSGGCNDAST